MRAVREQPRIVTARLLAAICLLAAGVALGSVLHAGSERPASAAQVRLVAVQRAASTQARALGLSHARVAELEAALSQARRRLAALTASNDVLRRDLRKARDRRRPRHSK